MAWSLTYKRRNDLMNNLEIPTITETRNHLGDSLASLVFEQCPEDMREDLGLEPLEGPGDELWISPSNVLKGNLCFSPLPTRKCIQALTHQGILEIGDEIEQKYRNYLEKLHREEIERVEDYMRALCALQKKRFEEQLRQEEYEKYAHQLEMLIDYYEKKIDEIIDAFRNEMREQTIKADEDLKQLDRKWNEKCREELTQATEDILTTLHNQEGSLVVKLFQKLKRMQAKEIQIVECIRAKYKRALSQLKSNLNRENSKKLKQSLNCERKKYRLQIEELKRYYDNEIKQLEIVISDQKQQIDDLDQIKTDKIEQLEYRENYLKEFIKQFKKFIYYALKAVPTQAEFLLDTVKLKRFEINERCLQGKSADVVEKKEKTQENKAENESTILPKICNRSTLKLDQSEDYDKYYRYPSLFETNDSIILLKEKLMENDPEIPIPKVQNKDEIKTTTDKERHVSKLLVIRDSVLLLIRNTERRTINSMKLRKKSQDIPANFLDRLSRRSSGVCSITREKFALHTDSLDIIRDNSGIKSKKIDENTDKSLIKKPEKSTETKNKNLVKPVKRQAKPKIIKKKLKTTKRQQAQVVGIDDKYPEEFTSERIQSLVNLLKANNSLRRLFTSVTR